MVECIKGTHWSLTCTCQSWLVHLSFHSVGPHLHHSPDHLQSLAPASEEDIEKERGTVIIQFSDIFILPRVPVVITSCSFCFLTMHHQHLADLFHAALLSPHVSLLELLSHPLPWPGACCYISMSLQHCQREWKMLLIKQFARSMFRTGWGKEKKPQSIMTNPQKCSLTGLALSQLHLTGIIKIDWEFTYTADCLSSIAGRLRYQVTVW